jgi:hypothetical protein
MRVEISLIGDPLEHADAMSLAEKVKRVLVGRAHKVVDLEMANEWSNGDKTDIDTMVEMVGILKPSGVKVIGLSSNFEDPIRDGLRRAGGTLLTAHSDRDPGSFKWRQVRQMRDCVVAGSDVMSENEPPGPHASVGGDNSSPLQLALMRATAHIQGCGLWVLHVADMVKGVLDPAHDRHANLEEVPNLDAILQAVRRVDGFLPDGVENWTEHESARAHRSRRAASLAGGRHLVRRGRSRR